MAFDALAQAELAASRELSCAHIPFLDLKAQFGEIRDELLDAVSRVLESQHFILGPEVEAFEREIAGYVEAEFAIAAHPDQTRFCWRRWQLESKPKMRLLPLHSHSARLPVPLPA